MTIPKETETEIARLYLVEKWKVGTIASQLGVHPTTVGPRARLVGHSRDRRHRRGSRSPTRTSR